MSQQGKELPEGKPINYGPQANRPHSMRRSFHEPGFSQFVVLVTSVHKVEADGVEVFYRAAGDPRTQKADSIALHF